MGGQGYAAVGDGDVEAGGAGEAADDGLAVGGHRADADLVGDDLRVVEAADGAAGAAEEFGGPAAQSGLGGVQVDLGVGRFQVDLAAGVGAQAEVGGVQQADRGGRGDRAGADYQAGRGGAGGVPGDQRHRGGRAGQGGQGGRPAAGAAHHLVGLQDIAVSGANSRCRARPGVQAGDAAGLAGQDVRAVAFRPRDQALDQRFGQDVTLAGEERGASCRRAERGLDLGCFGRVDEAGGVAPSGQAAHAGFEFGGLGVGVGQFDVADGAVPGLAVEAGRELGPGADAGVVEVVVGPGRLVVRVQPGETPPAGGAARLVLVQQRHRRACACQPGRHRGAEHARADHHVAAGSGGHDTHRKTRPRGRKDT